MVKFKQECIPVGCVSPARYLTGVSMTETPPRDPPDRDPNQIEIPRTETLLDRDPPGQRPTPGQRSPRDGAPWDGESAGTETPWDRDQDSPPREQNHRHV